MPLKVVGITGNIAVGKSTVSRMLAELGAQVLDADEVVHYLLERDEEVRSRVIARFGEGVTIGEQISRRKLGEVVFNDLQALQDLERILYPQVGKRLVAWLRDLQGNEEEKRVAVVDAIKLVESGFARLCDEVWLFTASEAAVRQRLRNDHKLSELEINARLAAQPPLEPKRKAATRLISNDGDLAALRAQVEKGWLEIMKDD